MNTEQRQSMICNQYDSPISAPSADDRVGLAIDTIGKMPIYGVRRPKIGDMDGWFIWCGEFSTSEDFFQPVHMSHIDDLLPLVTPYLALAPGHKFIIDDEGYEDVWYDESLLADEGSI